MNFTWDENKRQSNLKKHGLDFKQAHNVFTGITLTYADDRFEYGEQRFITLGMLDSAVAIAQTENASEIRIISMRKATKNEQKLYYRNIFR